MSSTEQYNPIQRKILLNTARASIEYGLKNGQPLPVHVNDFERALQQQRATFVTLNKKGELRGCIGHLQAIQALVLDVAENAFNAAFKDPRFPPLNADELPSIDIHISILSPAEPLQFTSQDDLLRQIRPGVDGLILQSGYHQGTFLPSVWEQLPDKRTFLSHLKLKAGLPADYWSDDIRVLRYTTESFSETEFK